MVCHKKVRNVPRKRARTKLILKVAGRRVFFGIGLLRVIGEVIPPVSGRVVALMGSASLTQVVTLRRVV